jgi:hypothetical protein
MDGAYGKFAIPDFILVKTNYDEILDDNGKIRTIKEETLGIVRVDGPVHDKKRIIIRDKFQVKNFLDRKIKVFIVDNAEIDGREPLRKIHTKKLKVIMRAPNYIQPPYIHLAMAKFFWDCMNDDKLYKLYMSEGDIKYRLGL